MKCKHCGYEQPYRYREDGILVCVKCKKPIKEEKRKPVFGMRDSAGIVR